MGVPGFFDIPVTNSESAAKLLRNIGREISLDELEGRRLSIDASIMIHRSILAFARIDTLTDAEGNPTGHIKGIMNKIGELKKAGIEQIWIFDNKEPHELKSHELAARKERKQKAEQRGDEKAAFRMTGTHIEDVKKLIDLSGVAWMIAPKNTEAEHVCAFLSSNEKKEDRFADYALSSDADVLLFGGNMIKMQTEKVSKKVSKVKYYAFELKDVLNALELDREQLIKVGICLKTDFQKEKIKGIGIKTCVKKVRDDSIDFSEHERIVKEFMREPNKKDLEISKREFDKTLEKKLRKFLKSKNFNDKGIDNYVKLL